MTALSIGAYQNTTPTYPTYQSQTTPTVSPAAYNPFNDSDAFGNDGFSSVTSLLAGGAGGGFASYKLGAKMGTDIKGMFGNGFQGFMGGLKNTALTGLKGMGLSALVGAGVSAVGNGVGVAMGKVDSSEAVSNVVGDTITSAVGGLGAVTAGGLGNMLLSKVGVGGIPLTIATVTLGAVGGVAASFLKQGMLD